MIDPAAPKPNRVGIEVTNSLLRAVSIGENDSIAATHAAEVVSADVEQLRGFQGVSAEALAAKSFKWLTDWTQSGRIECAQPGDR